MLRFIDVQMLLFVYSLWLSLLCSASKRWVICRCVFTSSADSVLSRLCFTKLDFLLEKVSIKKQFFWRCTSQMLICSSSFSHVDCEI